MGAFSIQDSVMGYATCWGGVVLGWLPTNVYAACSGGVVGLSSGDVDSCGDVPQYKVMKYLCLIPRSQPPEHRPAALAAHPRGPGG